MLQAKSSEEGKNVSTKNKFGTLRNEITVVQAKKESSKKMRSEIWRYQITQFLVVWGSVLNVKEGTSKMSQAGKGAYHQAWPEFNPETQMVEESYKLSSELCVPCEH